MTLEELTVDDIAAVLPTVSTGRAMGDWTEPDDRHTDAEWIRDTVIRAVERRNQVDKHHTTPERGNRNTAPLPPPKPGTHESDLWNAGLSHGRYWRAGLTRRGTNSNGHWSGGADECNHAAEWSRANR